MGSKSAQNLPLMPNLPSDYVGYKLNLCILDLFCLFDQSRPKKSSQHRAKIDPPESFMGSKSAQNLMLMPNLLSDYVGYNLNLCILNLFCLFASQFMQK